jgi:hypothetical protein
MTPIRRPVLRPLRLLRFALLAGVAVLASCDAPARAPAPPVPIAAAAPRAAEDTHATDERSSAAMDSPTGETGWPRRDLAADEALGGHTLARHVGRSDGELRDRLRRESGISAASTYTDRAIAERVVAEAIAASAGAMRRWEGRSGARPNFIVDYTAGSPVGRTLRRGARASEPCARAVVVLRWHTRDRRAYVLTSYPECGR